MPSFSNEIHLEREDLFGRLRLAKDVISPKFLTLVKGTFHGEWADPGSAFRAEVLEPAGIAVAARVDYWSGDASGIWHWLNPWAANKFSDWEAGGNHLADMLAWLPYEHRNLLTHSHGLQVGAFAAAQVTVRNFVSIAGPVRSDAKMRAVYQAAQARTERWCQVYDLEHDKTQWFGERFGGHWGGRVKHLPSATENIGLREIGHSRLLYDPAMFPVWSSECLTRMLTEEEW